MSLQVWLPLNGDLKNQGLANVITNGIGSDNSWDTTSSKIGKSSLLLTKITNTISVPSLIGKKEMSFAYWVRVNNAWSTNWLDGIRWYSTNGSTNTYSRQEFYTNCTKVGVWFAGSPNSNSGKDFSVGIWHHLAFSISYLNGTSDFYIDGALVGHTTGVYTDHYIQTGDFQIGDSGVDININDFRIYDHYLSAKEVKEIAKGLVLHYKLDNNGLGNPNLLPCKNTYIKSSPWTTSKSAKDGYQWITNSAFEAKPSATYTISVECDGTLNNAHVTSGVDPSYKYFTMWAYVCNTGTSKNWQNGQYDAAINLNSSNYNYRKIGNTHVWTITLSSSQQYISLRSNSYSDGSTVVTMNWWNMKVEEGSEFTGWVPDSFILNIIEDCSGYNHNGTPIGTLTISSDTTRYNSATIFDGNTSGILIENLQLSDIINTAVTYSFWIKPEEENGARSIYFGSYSSTSWSIEKTTGNKLRSYWNGSPDETSSATINDNVWQHIAITKNGTNEIKVYTDGELKWTSSAAHNNLTFPTTYRIGRDTRSGDGTPYHGLMSDFRIYATALSAEDIKELYNTSASIDNKGNVYAREVVEI